MDKELAHKVFMLNLEYERIQQKKWDLKQEFGYGSWDQVSTDAMRFMVMDMNVVMGMPS